MNPPDNENRRIEIIVVTGFAQRNQMIKGFSPHAESPIMRQILSTSVFAHSVGTHLRASLVMVSALFIAGQLGSSVLAQSGTYKHRAADGSVTFSDAPIRNGKVMRTSYKGTTRKPVVANPCYALNKAQLDAKGRKLDALFANASSATGVDASLLKAVARAESCFDPSAVSRAGAQGLMQLMPPTARELGVSNSFDATQNLSGGARYLAAMLSRYGNDLDLALAAYNAGPGNVDRYDGVPPFKETENYIASVKAFRKRYAEQHRTDSELASAQ